MPLPIFNLSAAIEAYNRKYRRNYTLDEDFGFGYFSKEMVADTTAAITIVNTGADRHLRTSQEKAFLKRQKELLLQYRLFLTGQIAATTRLSKDEKAIALLTN